MPGAQPALGSVVAAAGGAGASASAAAAASCASFSLIQAPGTPQPRRVTEPQEPAGSDEADDPEPDGGRHAQDRPVLHAEGLQHRCARAVPHEVDEQDVAGEQPVAKRRMMNSSTAEADQVQDRLVGEQRDEPGRLDGNGSLRPTGPRRGARHRSGSPRQAGGKPCRIGSAAVQLLVDEVAEPADGLAEQQWPRRRCPTSARCSCPSSGCRARCPARRRRRHRDADAAVPDLRDLDRVCE